jgi:putative membrane protein
MRALIFLQSAAILTIALLSCHKGHNDNSSVDARDKDFMTKAAYSNQTEVAAAKIAVSKDSSGPVNGFAMMMITDHTVAGQDLKVLADSLHVGLPDGTDPADAPVLNRLDSLTGHAFDTAYIHSQVTDHQKAVALFQGEADSGNNASVKAYALKYLPKLQMHLMMADSLNATIH